MSPYKKPDGLQPVLFGVATKRPFVWKATTKEGENSICTE